MRLTGPYVLVLAGCAATVPPDPMMKDMVAADMRGPGGGGLEMGGSGGGLDMRMPDMRMPLTLDFAPAVTYTIGQHANGVAIGDLNSDGKPDLAVVYAFSATVTVLLNQGGGIFLKSNLPTYPVGSGPTTVAIGDLNGDGKRDLIVSNQVDNTVTVLLNQGNGTFLNNPPSYPAGSTPSYVAIGDLNGDSMPDLAVANLAGTSCAGRSAVSVLINQGGGVFPMASPPSYAVGCPSSVAIGDLDGNGRLDLATPGALSKNVSVLLNLGSGVFPLDAPTNYLVGNTPMSLAIGDFDGDGMPDVAVANESSNSVSILRNRGDGTFPANNPSTYPAGKQPYAIVIADLDNDGQLDLAVANADPSASDVTVHLNQGSGTFPNSPLHYGVGKSPYSLAIGDLNGDDKLDLVTANAGDGTISVLLNTSQQR